MKKIDIGEKSIAFHKKHKGKLFTSSVVPIKNKKILSLVYTPGVGRVSSVVAKNPKLARDLTWKGRVVAVVSNGSAVLGLGDIGPLGALPVMEGKSILLKELAGVDSVPLVLNEKDTNQIIKIIKAVSPTYGAILLEDFASPECFEIEEKLKKILNIPILHDDQHGTAMVVLAGLINACRATKKELKKISVGIIGAGAAGTAIAKLLVASGIRDIRVIDRTGVLSKGRKDLNKYKRELALLTNPNKIKGDIKEGLKNCDVVIGVSGPGSISKEHIKLMEKDPVVFALANPTPEIMPNIAKASGAKVIATGRSDFPNQINNALIFPGLFKGLLKYPEVKVTKELMVAVALAVAKIIKTPTIQNIIPDVFNKKLVPTILQTIKKFTEK
jgi:malate dehydrogenase (oxaloacetate-decarboxylating)